MELLLLLSVPVFYITGLIAFIRWLMRLSKDKKVTRHQFLEEAVQELSKIVAATPDKKLTQQLEEYRKELDSLKAAEAISLPPPVTQPIGTTPVTTPIAATEEAKIISDQVVTTPTPQKTTSWQEDWEKVWGNWYSDNSINLLLYLGAFLIVASASIYVGFSWETLGGVMKATFFSLLTLAFFGFGTWFYSVPKIKNAGATFIAIGALLIPFNGLAWYNFVYGPAGYQIGSIWLITSLVAVFSYTALAYFIHHPFYTYIAGFGGLSMILSIVNVAEMDREFYILGGIFSAFVLLLSTKLFTKTNSEESKTYITPLSVSAHIIMPISLVWGFLLAAADNRLFTLEAATSAFLASLYYFIAYSFARQVSYLYISLFLFPLSLLLTGKFMEVETVPILIALQIVAVIYLLISPLLKEAWRQESEALSIVANTLMPISLFFVFILSLPVNIFATEVVLATFTATIFYFLAYYFSKETGFLTSAEMILAVFIFIFGKWLELPNLYIFNILAALALVYLATTYFIPSSQKKETEATGLVAHILLPFSALAVIFTSLQITGSLYKPDVVLTGFLATTFYILAYFIRKEITWAVVAQVIFPFVSFITARWLGLSTLDSFYCLEVVVVAYLILSYVARELKKEQESQTLIVIALSFAAGLFILTFPNEFSAFHQTIFAVLPAIYGLAAVYISDNDNYLYYNFAAITISVYLYFYELLGLQDKIYILGLAYLALTIIFYTIALITQGRKTAFTAFIHATIFNAALGSIFTAAEPKYFLVGNLIAAGLFLDAALRFKKHELIYFSNGMAYVALWSGLRIFDTRVANYPLFFAGLSYFIYAVSTTLPKILGDLYRLTGLVGIGANTIVFGLFGQGGTVEATYHSSSYTNQPPMISHELERNALISSYAATFLYIFDAALTKMASFGYFASAVGMFTYLWQMKYLGVTETQAYTLPLGVYFMVLAYLQRIGGRPAARNLLDWVGLFFLFVPTLFQSFGDAGAKYALLLGVEGVVVFGLGTSLSYKTYIYTGIAAIVVAIISQTYEFVFSLPRWVITATAGLAFLSTAIYLLLHRKEGPQK